MTEESSQLPTNIHLGSTLPWSGVKYSLTELNAALLRLLPMEIFIGRVTRLVHSALVDHIGRVLNHPANDRMYARQLYTKVGFQCSFESTHLVFDHLNRALSATI